MRSRMLLAGGLAVVLAACSTGSGQTPGGVASPEPSAVPQASPTTPPTVHVPALELAVTWDGASCTYEGPTVIIDKTLARFTYHAKDQVSLDDPVVATISGVTPGTSWDSIVAYWREHKVVGPSSEFPAPDWLHWPGTLFVAPEGTMAFTVSTDVYGDPIGGYFVGCTSGPEADGGSGIMAPATLLEIAGA